MLLTGSPENPTVENHSGKTVIGYVVKFADTNGRGEFLSQLMAQSFMQPAGIPDGGFLYGIPDGGFLYPKGAVPVNSTVGMSLPAQGRSIGRGPIVRAILQSVVFADGQFVGMDEYRTFELFGKKIKVFTEVGTLAKIGAWDQVEALAQAFVQAFVQIPPRIPDVEED